MNLDIGLAGKRPVVTGGNAGIGAAIVETLGAEDAKCSSAVGIGTG